jgi:eukaryotic-like serine/threonine-protein kinase
MKNLTKILLAIYIAIICVAVACKKDDPTPTPPVTTPTTTPPVVTKSVAKDITKFSFATLSPVVDATIDASTKAITATVPATTDVTKLVPTITISDKATVSPASGVAQDFSKEVSYTVTAEDASTVVYKVNVKKEVIGSTSTLSSTDQLVYVSKSVVKSSLVIDNQPATKTTFYIAAMDAITGKELSTWFMGESTKIGSDIAAPTTYTPSELGGGKYSPEIVYYNNNTLFTLSGELEARDAFTGKMKWAKNLNSITRIKSRNIVSANGVIYIAEGLTVLALDEVSGAEKWKKSVDYNTFKGVSTLTVFNELMYVSTDTGLLCLEIATGNEKWKLTKLDLLNQNRISSNPAVANGTVYFAGFDAKKLYAVDALTGKLKWESPLASYGGYSPTVSDGIVYMSCYCGTLYAMDEATGTLRWQQKLGGQYLGSPLADANNLYISDYDTKKTFALDKKTGAKKWETITNDRTEFTILAGNFIYINEEVLDAQTGTKKWEIPKIPYTNGASTFYGYPLFVILKNKYYASGDSGMIQ